MMDEKVWEEFVQALKTWERVVRDRWRIIINRAQSEGVSIPQVSFSVSGAEISVNMNGISFSIRGSSQGLENLFYNSDFKDTGLLEIRKRIVEHLDRCEKLIPELAKEKVDVATVGIEEFKADIAEWRLTGEAEGKHVI